MVGIFGVDFGVEVLDGPHVVDTVTVGCDDVREAQVLFNDYHVADRVAAAGFSGQGQRHGVITPTGVNVRCIGLTFSSLSVSECPNDMVAGIVGDVVGYIGRECNFTVVFAHHADFGVSDEIYARLRCGGDIVIFDKGVLASFGGGDDQFHGEDAGIFKVENRVGFRGVFYDAVLIEHIPLTDYGVGRGVRKIGETGDDGRAAGGDVSFEVHLRQVPEIHQHGVRAAAGGVCFLVGHLDFENVFTGGDYFDMVGDITGVPEKGSVCVRIVGVQNSYLAGAEPLVGTKVGFVGVDHVDVDAVVGPEIHARQIGVGPEIVPTAVAHIGIVQCKGLIPNRIVAWCNHKNSVHRVGDVVENDIFVQTVGVAHHEFCGNTTVKALTFKENAGVVRVVAHITDGEVHVVGCAG